MMNAAERLSLEEKLELIKGRARIMGFRRHDLEDAVQEAVLAVLEFEYVPEKSNGATETTALITVIDRKLVSLKRANRRYAGLIERATDRLSVEYQGCEDGPFEVDRAGEDSVANSELEEVIAQMDEEMQQVCRLMMEGMLTRSISRQLKMGWRRVDELVTAIRGRMEAVGLNPTFVE